MHSSPPESLSELVEQNSKILQQQQNKNASANNQLQKQNLNTNQSQRFKDIKKFNDDNINFRQKDIALSQAKIDRLQDGKPTLKNIGNIVRAQNNAKKAFTKAQNSARVLDSQVSVNNNYA